MIAFAAAFPDTLTVEPSTASDDPRQWVVRTDDGVSMFLTEAQADNLASALLNRHGQPANQRKAA